MAQRTAVVQWSSAVCPSKYHYLVSIGPAPKDRIKYSELKFQEWPVLSLPSRQRIGADLPGQQSTGPLNLYFQSSHIDSVLPYIRKKAMNIQPHRLETTEKNRRESM